MLSRRQAPTVGWMRWTVLGLCTLLVLGSLGGSTASQVQIYGKSVYAGHFLGSRHDGRGQAHQARRMRKNVIHRSLDLEAFNIHVAPTTSKNSIPTIIKLFPPTVNPLSTNMPLRFGRDNSPSTNQQSNSNVPLRFGRDDSAGNIPLRFGRAFKVVGSRVQPFSHPWRWFRLCPTCTDVEKQLLGFYWSLLRTIHTN